MPRSFRAELHARLSLPFVPVCRLPELHSQVLHEGHPCDGAFHRPVQWYLPVGSADGAEPADRTAESGGFHQVYPRGTGSTSVSPSLLHFLFLV